MQDNFLKQSLSVLGCVMLMAGAVSADTKITSRQTAAGQTYENTTLIKGKRQRTESNNGQMVMIQQCDLQRNVQLMPSGKVYLIQPYGNTTSSSTTANTTSTGSTTGGVVTSTITTKDTGERKQMFGYTARHMITTISIDSTPNACNPMKSKMEFDGWYIDAAFALECGSQNSYSNYQSPNSSGCRDRYETKQIGTAKRGYPVWEKMTMFDQNGSVTTSTINEVVELSQTTLDAALFEVPSDYREVKDYASLYSSTSNNSSSSGESATPTISRTESSTTDSSSRSTTESTAIPAQPATNGSAEKKDSVIQKMKRRFP